MSPEHLTVSSTGDSIDLVPQIKTDLKDQFDEPLHCNKRNLGCGECNSLLSKSSDDVNSINGQKEFIDDHELTDTKNDPVKLSSIKNCDYVHSETHNSLRNNLNDGKCLHVNNIELDVVDINELDNKAMIIEECTTKSQKEDFLRKEQLSQRLKDLVNEEGTSVSPIILSDINTKNGALDEDDDDEKKDEDKKESEDTNGLEKVESSEGSPAKSASRPSKPLNDDDEVPLKDAEEEKETVVENDEVKVALTVPLPPPQMSAISTISGILDEKDKNEKEREAKDTKSKNDLDLEKPCEVESKLDNNVDEESSTHSENTKEDLVVSSEDKEEKTSDKEEKEELPDKVEKVDEDTASSVDSVYDASADKSCGDLPRAEGEDDEGEESDGNTQNNAKNSSPNADSGLTASFGSSPSIAEVSSNRRNSESSPGVNSPEKRPTDPPPPEAVTKDSEAVAETATDDSDPPARCDSESNVIAPTPEGAAPGQTDVGERSAESVEVCDNVQMCVSSASTECTESSRVICDDEVISCEDKSPSLDNINESNNLENILDNKESSTNTSKDSNLSVNNNSSRSITETEVRTAQLNSNCDKSSTDPKNLDCRIEASDSQVENCDKQHLHCDKSVPETDDISKHEDDEDEHYIKHVSNSSEIMNDQMDLGPRRHGIVVARPRSADNTERDRQSE